MTTRAGMSGLVTGCVLIVVLFYPFYIILPGIFVYGWPARSERLGLALVAVAAAVLVAGGGWAAWWGGARSRAQRASLGAVAGSLAGLVLFCGLGAAAAGAAGAGPLLASAVALSGNAGRSIWLHVESTIRIVWWTGETFWALALVGAVLGAVGGLYVRPFPPPAGWEPYDQRHPQMALNAAITAVPSAAGAALLAAYIYSVLLGQLRSVVGLTFSLPPQGVLLWPVVTALLIYLVSLAALALVTPHEARQARHRCGLDEVKMAAWVGIFVPPALAVLLYLINPALALTPTVFSVLLVSGALCVSQILTLRALILPKRAQLPPPVNPMEALLFGSISRSQGPRLVVLCLGCGLAVMAPAYVGVGAAALSLGLMSMPLQSVFLGGSVGTALSQAALVQRLYLAQPALALGLMGGAALALCVLYLFYLQLGRWFSQTVSREV
jgi:hypothetical protein